MPRSRLQSSESRIVSIRLHRYCLPLRNEWRTSDGRLNERRGWLVRLETASGLSGFGDCAPLPGCGTETFAEANAALIALLTRLHGLTMKKGLAELAHMPANKAPATRCAVETALLDLAAQQLDLSLADLLRGPTRSQAAGRTGSDSLVAVHAALGSLDEITDQTILTACAAGYRVLKLKVGRAPIDHEVDRLRHILTLLPPHAAIRLDANRAWNPDAAVRFVSACADRAIDMIEEPLATPGIDALCRLQSTTAIALAVDESITRLGVRRLLAIRPTRRLVLKPVRCGGLQPAIAIARRAVAAGIACVVTTSLDSAAGVAAAAHLAAALDNGLAHGLATSSWLAEDTGHPLQITDGTLRVGHWAGLGFLPWPHLDFVDLLRD